jgi:hypothetical protein
MKKIAMILNGSVYNIAAWDGLSVWLPGEQFTLVDVTDRPEIQIGWSFDGEFHPPVKSEDDA